MLSILRILILLFVAALSAFFALNTVTKVQTHSKDHADNHDNQQGDHSGYGNPVSVNYHFTRRCNRECQFCFHTEKTSHVESEDRMRAGLKLLRDAGMKKINFAGGEPFLYPKILAMLCRYCKEELQLESVSIISNGTKITEKWLQDNAKFIDILGVSCDSFDEDTNIAIGRGTGENVNQLFQIRDWCRELGMEFKLNTVVCTLNWKEDMSEVLSRLAPDRWKCFQVLLVGDENDDAESTTRLDKRKRNARKMLISDEEYGAFCDRHRHIPNFIPESNDIMASSYLLVDEYLCFLDKGSGKEKKSRCILDVGVFEAMKEVRWDQDAFRKRGGIYDWSFAQLGDHCGSELPKELDF